MDGQTELISALNDARDLVARSGNDFTYSSWEGPSDALREIDGLIATLEAGRIPPRLDMTILFAPTGDLQEVSLSSGWADEFLSVSSRFDEALERCSTNFEGEVVDESDDFLQRFDAANRIMKIVAGMAVIATVVVLIVVFLRR